MPPNIWSLGTVPSILLHSTQGGSDKVYLLKVVSRGTVGGEPKYDVIYANGRRSAGATAGHKAKNTRPLSFTAATELMYDLSMEKQSKKGYHEMGGCSLCGGGKPLLTLPPPVVIKNNKPVVNENFQKELVKTFAPTWYERTISLDDDVDL